MINPATGKEDPNYKPTQTVGGTQDVVKQPGIPTGNVQTNTPGGFDTLMQYKDQYRSLTPEQQTGANALFKQYTSIPGSDVTSAAQKALSTYITSPVTTQPTEAAKTTTGGIPTAPITTQPTNTGITGIAPVDTELEKLKQEKQKTIDDTYKSYEIAQGQYQQNAGYYTNFNDINQKFNNVISDVKNALQQSGTPTLTDQQYQQIASKYGLGLQDVKNPTSIFNQLQPTEEGKQKLGISKAEQGITDMQTQFDRQKADLATNIQIANQNIDNQIADVQKQLDRNLGFATAQGAWMGGLKSSGYQQGLQNIKTDGQTIISRLNAQKDQLNAANEKDVARLTEDFNKNLSQAKVDLDNQLQSLKFDNGLQLNALTDKYGASSTELTKALDAINEQFGTKSLDVFNKYLDSVKNIQSITSANISQMEKLNDLNTQAANKRYNEYVANNGVLLQNSSLTNMANEVKSGTLSLQKYQDLKNVMLSSITGTLSKNGVVDEHDLNTITHLLDIGNTPAQIVANMQSLDKFTPKTTIDKTFNVGDETWVQYSNGKVEKVQKEIKPTESWTKLDDKTLYNQTTGETKSVSSVLNTSKGSDLLSIPDGSSVPSGRTQCGQYANDVLGTPGLFKDTIEQKKAVATDTEPTIGGAVVFSSTGKYAKYGHVGIVVGEDANSITVKSSNWDGDGKITTERVSKSSPMIEGYYNPQKEAKVDSADIGVFNSLTPSDTKKMQNDPSYRKFVETKKNVMNNPDAKIDDILEYSRGGKDISDTAETQLAKFNQALNQLGPLQDSISKTDTGPILGILRSYNPYDTSAQKLKAQINSLIPNLARGVYGEVGVLTDNDIANYSKTVPNLKSTQDVNNAILAMTLKTVANGYKSKLQSLASAGRDVSGYGGAYTQIENKVNDLLSQVEGTQTKPVSQSNILDRIKQLRSTNK